MVGGSTRIPKVQSEVSNLLGDEKIIKNINPDEIVALGAAIQAGIIAGDKKGVVLVDVTPLSLGIEIEGGIFTPIIERNSSIPTTQTKLFTTVADKQKSVEIHVLQGERTRASENISLGKFQLSGIRNAEKGEPRIEVTFGVDVDGIVNVTAKDLDTDAEHHITIKNQVALSQDEIEKIIEEARKNKEEDLNYLTVKKKIEMVKNNRKVLNDTLNRNDGSINIEEELKNDIEKAINQADKIIREGEKSGNLEEISELNDNLTFLLGELNAELEKIDLKGKKAK
jgi:molecular chaperone DnaK